MHSRFKLKLHRVVVFADVGQALGEARHMSERILGFIPPNGVFVGVCQCLLLFVSVCVVVSVSVY